jgi:hypothetical protein
LHRFDGFTLLRVYNDHIGEDVRELLRVEELRGLLLVTCIIDVENLSVLLEDRFELTNIPTHIERWGIYEEQGFHCLSISILEFLPKVLEIRIKGKFHIERSREALVEYIDCKGFCLDSTRLGQ